MSLDANHGAPPPSIVDIRAAQRRSQPRPEQGQEQGEKAFDAHLNERIRQERNEARAEAKARARAEQHERAVRARKNEAPAPSEPTTPPQSAEDAPKSGAAPAEEPVALKNTPTKTDTSTPSDGTVPVPAATVAEAPTTQALKQDIAVTAEDEVIKIIAPEGKPETEAGLPGEKKASDTNGLTPKPETTEDAGVNEALTALKNLVGTKDQNPTASTDTAPKTADEAVKAAAKAIAEAATQQAKDTQASEKAAETALSLDGSKGRSIAQQLLDEARALKERKASATAIAKTQEVAQTENAVGNRILAGLEKAVTEVTKTSTPAENVNKLQQDVTSQATDPLLTLDEMGEEAAAETAGRAIETKPKTEAKPAEGLSRPAAEIAAPAKGLPQVQPANGAAPELVVSQKVADVQGLTSTSAKPELAHLPQQSSQAVPVQTVGLHIARQALRGQTQFDIRLDPPELGRIEVKLEIGDDGRMRAHMVAEKAETLDLLQRDQRQLERTMAQNGMKGFEDGLSFSLKDEGSGQGSAGGREQADNGKWTGDGAAETDGAGDGESKAYRQVRVGGVDVSV